ncbi:MAG: tetratricopeptide repeat protein, partial [Thiomargarita sp.]|nr:tetratricopeptide repeat protein [Thiomargarita sp.]
MQINKQRQVKLFISSTFRGLYDERNVLAKQVFPEIHRRCRERKVDFVEIDLRWGIPKEQVKSGVAVPICLGRIDDGRPYFLGLLGERYGSAMYPEQIPDICEKYPHYDWVKKYPDRSITELEILHALFPVGQMTSDEERQETIEQALFYFRDPHYAQTQSKPDYYKEDTSENVQKQNALKQRIRDLGCQVKEYQKPTDLKELVSEQLWALIDKAFPEGSQPTEFERENIEHDAFAHSRELVYIRRQTDFDCLTAHARDKSTQPLVILGESGSGKSALLANWVRDYQEKHQDELVFWHFCGCSEGSTNPIVVMQRLTESLQKYFQMDTKIPHAPEAVMQHLSSHISQKRIIVIIDGLNQLEQSDRLIWLLNLIPASVRLMVSVLPNHDAWKTLQQIKGACSTLTVQPLSAQERTQLIVDYLEQYGRKLENAHIQRIVAAPQTANPLYLRILLEELRLFGNFSKLPKEINDYLEAKTIPDLYQKMLARLENDYKSWDMPVQKKPRFLKKLLGFFLPKPEESTQPQTYPHLVEKAMTFLWASRRGLGETELLNFLIVQQAIWSPLYLALQAALVNRAGLLNFANDYLRQAVEQYCLTDADKKKAAHRRLATFFELQPISSRKADELPYQLEQAGERVRLQACLSEIPMLLQFLEDERLYELLGYWRGLEKEHEMLTAYPQALVEYEKTVSNEGFASAVNEVAFFYNTIGVYTEEIISLARRALAIIEKVLGAEHPDTATSLNNLALLLSNKGDYDSAEPLYRRALAIREKVLGAEHPDTAQSLNNLALLLSKKGNYDGAEPLYRRALAIHKQVLGAEHPSTATSLNNLALLLSNKGDYDGAEPLYRRALAIREKVLGAEHPDTATSLNNLAALLDNKGDYDSA